MDFMESNTLMKKIKQTIIQETKNRPVSQNRPKDRRMETQQST